MFDDIYQFFKDWFVEITDFFRELPVLVLDGVLGAIASVIESIPMPDFMSTYQISNYIPADIGWLLVQSGFPQALAIVGSGYAFYFLRRVLTIGIW